jgi:hypothetical protein
VAHAPWADHTHPNANRNASSILRSFAAEMTLRVLSDRLL